MNRSRYTPRPRASIGSPFLSNSRISLVVTIDGACQKESVRVLVFASAYVAEGVNHALVGQDAVGVDEVFDELRIRSARGRRGPAGAGAGGRGKSYHRIERGNCGHFKFRHARFSSR